MAGAGLPGQAPPDAAAGARVLLHVGMHKTGSSSIQRYLAAIRAGDGFRYLDLGRGPNHSGAMYAGFSRTPEQYHNFRRRKLTAEQVLRVREYTRDAIARQLGEGPGLGIVSGEDMTSLDAPSVLDLRDFLASRSVQQQVLAYVRAPRSFMESAFQQRVRGGLGQWNPRALYPGYRRRFLKFEQAFGRDQVHYRPFVRDCLARGDVVADFCLQAGIASPDARVALNQGLSRRAVGLLFTYRKFGGMHDALSGGLRENRALFEALGTLPGPRLRLAGPATEAILASQHRDLAWMESRLGMALPDDPVPDGDGVDAEADLLRYDEAQVEWLRGWCGHPGLAPGMSPEVAAAALHEAVPAMIEQFRSPAPA